MEVSAGSSHSNGKQTLKHSTSIDEGKRPSEKSCIVYHSNRKQNLKQTSSFVNHAATLWHENRRKWVGDRSQHPPRIANEPIISFIQSYYYEEQSFLSSGSVDSSWDLIFPSWSTSYEELLSSNEPFTEPIPLPEMVDFLVDIWHDEGLFDWIVEGSI